MSSSAPISSGNAQSTRRRSGQRGQTTTEYVLVLSVLVIAIAGVSYSAFFGDSSPVREGMNALLDEDSASNSKTNIPTAVNRGFVSKNPQPN